MTGFPLAAQRSWRISPACLFREPSGGPRAPRRRSSPQARVPCAPSPRLLRFPQQQLMNAVEEDSIVFKMEVDINGESRSTLSTLPVPLAEVSPAGRMEAEKPRCSSTPCSPMRRTVAGYQILHMDSNYLVGFTTGEELLKLAQKCTGNEENKGEFGPNLRTKQLDSGLARSSRLYKTRSRYYQPYEIPAVNGRRRRRMPSSGDKCTKALPYEPYKALHGPLPLCLLKGKRAHSKSLDYLNLDKMSIKEPADTEVLQYQLQHLTLRGDRMFARNNT
ncbi:macrophage immunometabolism regulator isoform X1 [Aptenodytes patagonicus]|uniref:macrophage immunometabolism regulator isoform X1 n=1 Tax=Aptenodytes patagonicus TaxID=9234 RepID=UPI003F9F4A16